MGGGGGRWGAVGGGWRAMRQGIKTGDDNVSSSSVYVHVTFISTSVTRICVL